MRIISGKYRGKKLKEFDIASTRPTQDRVKESIFNLIQFDVVGSQVLDLFSGTGALGIECISRGAEFVYLVDKNKQAINLINSNLKGVEGNYSVQNMDFMEFLTTHLNLKFDIVLLDPPFATNYAQEAIQYITENNMLNQAGIIIFETSENKNFELNKQGYSVKKYKYGTVAVYKIEKNEN